MVFDSLPELSFDELPQALKNMVPANTTAKNKNFILLIPFTSLLDFGLNKNKKG
jgi:hypothetical protein